MLKTKVMKGIEKSAILKWKFAHFSLTIWFVTLDLALRQSPSTLIQRKEKNWAFFNKQIKNQSLLRCYVCSKSLTKTVVVHEKNKVTFIKTL